MRRGRRAVAAAVLAALAVGVGLFVAVWALGGGGGDDEARDDDAAGDPLDSVDALGAVAGCDAVDAVDGALPVPGVEDLGLCVVDDVIVATLQVTADGDDRDGLVAYLTDVTSQGGAYRPCDHTAAPVAGEVGVGYAVVAGERWVLLTWRPEVRDAAVAAGGEEVPGSPIGETPVSYPIDVPPCGEAPIPLATTTTTG